MAWPTLLFIVTCFLAYVNGANDNFKGVATLFGSRTTNYKTALAWATVTTFAGSACAVFFAVRLLRAFSGKGIVSDATVASPDFALAIGIGAAFTVMLATLTGFPISTTHSLIGALTGAGLVAVGAELDFAALTKSFVLPLLLSPLLATVLASGAYAIIRPIARRLDPAPQPGLIAMVERSAPVPNPGSANPHGHASPSDAATSEDQTAARANESASPRTGAERALDLAHYASAGVVSFARGVNDTPKIVALLLLVHSIGIQWSALAVAAAMAGGGILNARRVAETMSKKITPLDHPQGFAANLVTGALVLFASRLGMPVSTTHVSCGSLFGIGAVTRKANTLMIFEIILSWVLTLPVAAAASALAYLTLIAA
ncbi:MAG: anion permease [Armatimonadota bacterium]